MHSLRSITLVIAVAFTAVACGDITDPNMGDPDGGNNGGGDGGTGTIDAATGPDAFVDPCTGDIALEDFWDCAMDVVCDVFLGCLGGGAGYCDVARNQLFLYDNFPVSVSEEMFADAIAAGSMTYSGTRAADCLAAISGQECWELIGESSPFGACNIFEGSVNPNGSCISNEECVGAGAQCQRIDCGNEDVCCMGQCVSAAPVGQSCASVDCVPGAHCRNNICQAGEAGDGCTSDSHCDPDFHCNPSNECAADFPSGAVCTQNNQCAAPQSCLGNDLPQSSMGNCGDSYQNGDSCDQGGCLGFFSAWCDQPDPNVLGTCRPIPGVNESCAVSGTCGLFLECDQNTQVCVQRGDVGDNCSDSNNDCEFFLYCTNEVTNQPAGTCSLPSDVNAQCTDGSHCTSGLCVNGSCAAYPDCLP